MSDSYKKLLLKSAAEIIVRDFNLDPEKVNFSDSNDHEKLKEVLTRQVAYLLAHDLERLKWILYRVDVNEQNLHETLSEHSPAASSGIIAKMILQRQLEKAETRLKYQQGRL